MKSGLQLRRLYKVHNDDLFEFKGDIIVVNGKIVMTVNRYNL